LTLFRERGTCLTQGSSGRIRNLHAV
jgi:hypothetical protein